VYYYSLTHRDPAAAVRTKSRSTIDSASVSSTTPFRRARNRRSLLAVSLERSCAHLHPALSVCASHTRIMSLASPRRAVAAEPFAKRKIQPLSRIGLVDSGWDRKSGHVQVKCAWTGSITAWDSENNEPNAKLMDDIFHALDRLACRDTGEKRSSRDFILV
jgi:hypothetical protein